MAVGRTRALILIAPLLVLAACHPYESAPANTANAEPGITPEYVASLPPGQSRPVVSMLANEVVAAETELCNENTDLDWNACVSSRMLVAFDRYGFLATHCQGKDDYKALRDCVEFGRGGVDWILAMGGNPDADFDWSKPEQSHAAALAKLNDVLTKRCESKPEEPGKSCFTRLSAELLGLGSVVAERCATRSTLEERGACVVDAHDTAMYRAALAILSR